MITAVYVPSVREAASFGKMGKGKPLFLASLPRDVHNLITPFLVHNDLYAEISSLERIYKDESRPLSDRIRAIRSPNTLQTVRKCSETLKRLQLFCELIEKRPEDLLKSEFSQKISEFLKFCDDSGIHYRTCDRIMERRGRAVSSRACFKHLDGRSVELFNGANRSGYRVLPGFLHSSLYVQIPLKADDDFDSDFYHYSSGRFRDVALASKGILFMAKKSFLEVYDLRASKYDDCGRYGSKFPTAQCLYKLDYQFDRITWNQERKCLIGEKNGDTTELRFDAYGGEVLPKRDYNSHLSEKVDYVVKRVLKIIFVEGAESIFAVVKESSRLYLLSCTFAFSLSNKGICGVGLFVLGVLINAVAIPIFLHLAIPSYLLGYIAITSYYLIKLMCGLDRERKSSAI